MQHGTRFLATVKNINNNRMKCGIRGLFEKYPVVITQPIRSS
jgi:hypothetical protein